MPTFMAALKVDPQCENALMASLTIENYVKTIYLICANHADQPAATGQLAEALSVSPGTVTSMLKALSESGLAEYQPYEGVRLTASGRRLAMRIIRRHRLIETFLVQTLDLTWDEVHDEAEDLEHAVSDLLINRIDEFLGFPTVDPHGDPIPSEDGQIAADRGMRLDQLTPKTRFQLVRVMDQSSGFLKYLTDASLSVGCEAELGEIQRQTGVVKISLQGREIVLSLDSAEKLLVEPVIATPSADAPGPV